MATNLIPMAGKGKRFSDAGYKASKPLILVSGKPMIVQAASTFPKADNWVFVCQKDAIEKDKVDEAIKSFIPNAMFIPIDYVTEGQACTCLLAKEMIDPEEPLFIGSCDVGIVWDKERFESLSKEEDTDVVCFAFTRQSALAYMPGAFGWIKTREDKKHITGVSVKIPISNDPYNDYAVVGHFYFKKAKYFFEIAEDLIRNNIRVNGEFYVDSCVSHSIKLGYKPKVFVVDQHISWGTPQELQIYEFWERYFSRTKRI